MATVSALWEVGKAADIHLVAGSGTPRLDNTALVLEQSTGANVWATPKPADVATVEFIPRFAPQGVQAAGFVSGRGVTVDKSTGQITVAAALPGAPRLYNFLLVATVTLTAAAGGRVLDPVAVRVHVHVSVSDFWLTPNPLTVYHGADDTRLSLLARFDDGVVGDISRLPDVAWASADSARLTVDPLSGALRRVTHPASVAITATLPASWGGAARTATVDTRPPRSTTGDVRPLGATAGRLADVPNILILSEGFQPGERDAFFDLAQLLVHQVQTLQSTRPYDRLPINYWGAFVPSRDRGVSVSQALKLLSTSTLLYNDFPEATAPAVGAAVWTLPELIYEVGLPIPADSGIGRAANLVRWQTVYGMHVTGARVPPALYDSWQAIAGYRLTDERDTAFGLAVGSRPSVEAPDDLRGVTWHPFRATRAHLDTFLGTLRAGSGLLVGTTWQAGRDRPLIFMLCGGAPSAGTQTPAPNELIASGAVTPQTVTLAFPSGPPRARVVPHALPRIPSPGARATLVHEISHAFGLGDEYGTELTLPASGVADVDARANLLSEQALLTAGALDGDKIKWRWPRLRAAGVLAGPPVAQVGGFKLTLVPGHTTQFRAGQIVRLRRRPLPANPVLSDRLEVTGVNPVTHEVTLKLVPGSALVPANFAAGSVVVEPRRAPAPPGTLGADQELVAAVIRAHIKATQLPLNRSAAACAKDDDVIQQPRNLPPAASLRPNHPPWPTLIVGLWDGGAEYHCGVFHPSGACLMRQLNVSASNALSPNKMYRLCHVCRYVLVDSIEPTLHRLIDDDYDRDYPQP